MFNNTKESVERKYYTGPFIAKVIAVNPTQKEAVEKGITSGDYDFDDSYEVKELYGAMVRPVDFYLQDLTGNITYPIKFTIYIGEEDAKTKNGKSYFVNGKNKKTVAESIDELLTNDKYSYFTEHNPIRELKIGQFELLNFISQWFRLDTDFDITQEFLDKKNEGILDITNETIFKGDYSGLKLLVENSKNNVVAVATVHITESGKMYQNIIKDTFYRATSDTVSEKTKIAIAKLAEKEDYPVTKDYFSSEFQEFAIANSYKIGETTPVVNNNDNNSTPDELTW